MPYQSTAQRGYMHVHHPDIAARWDKYPNQKNLPRHKKKNDRRQRLVTQFLAGRKKAQHHGHPHA